VTRDPELVVAHVVVGHVIQRIVRLPDHGVDQPHHAPMGVDRLDGGGVVPRPVQIQLADVKKGR